MFRNKEGFYRLEFSAAVEREHPSHTLYLDIDGEQFLWDISDNKEFLIDIPLRQHASIRIVSSKPSSFGHAIDICLTVMTP